MSKSILYTAYSIKKCLFDSLSGLSEVQDLEITKLERDTLRTELRELQGELQVERGRAKSPEEPERTAFSDGVRTAREKRA